MWKQLQKKYLGSTIPVVNVHGLINPQCTEKVARRLANINTSRAAALAVSVNSPGGFPVQSQIIANKIKNFATKNNLKVYTFARDLAASGGYFVLCTGHHVVADTTSQVGNIGVVIPKLQLEGLLELTSVEHKFLSSNKESLHEMMNPFHNLNQEERAKIMEACGWTHERFIEFVKKHRGSKIKDDKDIFSGEIYTGEEAASNGLVDEVGTIVEVLDKRYPGCKLELEHTGSWAKSLVGSF